MEFFATSAVKLRAEELQRHVRIDNLPLWCASIDKVLSHEGERGDIYCIWGEFRVRREIIRQGVRFSLPGCINALQWTVTMEEDGVRVHCTTNRVEHEADFAESLQQFADDWREGLDKGLAQVKKDVGEAPACGFWIA